MLSVEEPITKQISIIPLTLIWADEHWNCRGPIKPADVIDLARDIQDHGLDQPVTIQPFFHTEGDHTYQYRLVAGYRRYKAHQVIRKETIECIIRNDLDELRARFLNLRENLHRQKLNIKQEAISLQFFLDQKKGGKPLFTEEEIALSFGQSRGWVQVRKMVLGLPPLVQDEAAAEMLTQDQIKMLAKLKNPQQQLEAAKKIKERKLRGEKGKINILAKRPGDALKRKRRDVSEINELLDDLYDLIGPSLALRCLAWAAGNISIVELYNTVQQYCEDRGIPYKRPEYIQKALTGLLS